MRKFIVNVDGKSYDVEIEEVSGNSAPAQVAPRREEPKPEVKKEEKPAPAASKNGEPVKAPMPGLILNLSVANGSTVKKGDKILVLEAMKMENDIVATADGVVTYAVKKGDNVESGAVLAFIA